MRLLLVSGFVGGPFAKLGIPRVNVRLECINNRGQDALQFPPPDELDLIQSRMSSDGEVLPPRFVGLRCIG